VIGLWDLAHTAAQDAADQWDEGVRPHVTQAILEAVASWLLTEEAWRLAVHALIEERKREDMNYGPLARAALEAVSAKINPPVDETAE